MSDELNLDELEQLAKMSATYWFGKETNLKLIALARKGQTYELLATELSQHLSDSARRAERLEKALRLATVRLQILVDRMRGCIEDGGHHGLMDESQAYVDEAREALEEKP